MAVSHKLKVKPKVKGLGAKTATPLGGKWRDDLAFRLYDLFKAGMTLSTAAGVMGVRTETLSRWVQDIPLAKAARAAADAARAAESMSFQDYAYNQLPSHLRPVWEKIMAAGEDPDPVARIEAALAGQGAVGRQYMFIHALIHSNFNVSEASRLTNLDRRTFQLWMKNDAGFADIIDELHHSKKDLVEGKLIELVKNGDTSAVLFASRTLNKDRGYGDSKSIKIDQTTTHKHLIDIDELDLSLEVRKAILEAMRKQRSPEALGSPVDVPALPARREPVAVYDAVQDELEEDVD